jgi:Tfp pilus assembly protein PilV
LLEVLVGAIVGGVGLYAILQGVAAFYRSAAKQETRSDLLDLRQHILENLDCVDSITPRPAACNYGHEIDLLHRDPARPPLVHVYNNNGYVRMFGFEVRSRCIDCPNCTNLKSIVV